MTGPVGSVPTDKDTSGRITGGTVACCGVLGAITGALSLTWPVAWPVVVELSGSAPTFIPTGLWLAVKISAPSFVLNPSNVRPVTTKPPFIILTLTAALSVPSAATRVTQNVPSFRIFSNSSLTIVFKVSRFLKSDGNPTWLKGMTPDLCALPSPKFKSVVVLSVIIKFLSVTLAVAVPSTVSPRLFVNCLFPGIAFFIAPIIIPTG